MFKLHYHVRNNGDGSVSVQFHPNEKAARDAEDAMDEGWGESCADFVHLKVEDGRLFYESHDYVNNVFQKVWLPTE